MNPFSGSKNLYHAQYWSSIERGVIPPPVLVTIDPINICNLKCQWCNGKEVMNSRGTKLDSTAILELPRMLSFWGVKAVCIAGGGEPLLHEMASELIHGLHECGVQVGVVTNGTRMHLHTAALGKCRWVGVSVDAGCAPTYERLKGANKFKTVIDNISTLRAACPDLEITYKYLITPDNIRDIQKAAQVAKSIGCNFFHARPVGLTWSDIQSGIKSTSFSLEDVQLAEIRLETARACEDEQFKIIGSTEKFTDGTWERLFDFSTCHAVGMTCVISGDGTCGLCCDRRGDKKTLLCNWTDVNEICAAWGSDKHFEIMQSIDFNDCPRCTYAPHNRLYEEYVMRDDNCKYFI